MSQKLFARSAHYKAYSELPHPPSGLQAFETDENNHAIIHIGELFCRVPDEETGELCGNRYSNRGALYNHVKADHGGDNTTAAAATRTGNPSNRALQLAARFYKGVMEKHFELEKNKPAPEPVPNPLRRNRFKIGGSSKAPIAIESGESDSDGETPKPRRTRSQRVRNESGDKKAQRARTPPTPSQHDEDEFPRIRLPDPKWDTILFQSGKNKGAINNRAMSKLCREAGAVVPCHDCKKHNPKSTCCDFREPCANMPFFLWKEGESEDGSEQHDENELQLIAEGAVEGDNDD